MARHHEFEAGARARPHAIRYDDRAGHRSSRRFAGAETSRPLGSYLTPTVTQSNGVKGHELARLVSQHRD
eukprot:6765584-Prymnesium_polylepis.2